MSSFQNVLEDQLRSEQKTVATQQMFSLKIFSITFLILITLSVVLLAWSYLSKDQTISKLKGNLPSKTVLLDSNSATPIYNGQTLTMEPVVSNTTRSDNTNSNSTILPAPAQGLFEISKAGATLPIKRQSDGLTAFRAYKSPFVPPSLNKPLLSVVMYDVGLSEAQFNQLIENLPKEVSFSISPYSSSSQSLTDYARESGHEIWLTLPLETRNYPIDDPGPLTLLTEENIQKNTQRLHKTLSSTQGYVGVVAQKNHRYTERETETSPYIKEILERGLAVLDSNPYQSNFVKSFAGRKGYPYGKNNFWFDDDLSPLAFNKKIREIIEFGETTGSVVVMMRPYPSSLKAMNKFLNSAAANKFHLAPLSAQMKTE